MVPTPIQLIKEGGRGVKKINPLFFLFTLPLLLGVGSKSNGEQLVKLELECKKGNPQACLEAGNYYYTHGKLERAYRLYWRCRNQKGGCLNNIAVLYYNGYRKISPQRVLLMLGKACKMGDKAGCINYQRLKASLRGK
jgi:TPR repeat protein